ncbi:RnfABCDGE type electron transport complex subunit D [Candidatus Parcubacteria bacterium]|nr:RnfABCDGE type electron transport complex subunit D [Candidatus Parcubacteria bacterium]
MSVVDFARRFWQLGIKVHLLWILAVIVLAAWFSSAKLFAETWPQVAVGLTVGGGLDLALAWWRRRVLYLPQSGLITGLIVAIVLAPASPLWQVAAAAAMGILSKHVIRWRGRQLLNPAALGLAATVIFAGALEGWWGDVVPAYVAVLGAFIITRTRKWPVVAAFAAAWMFIAVVKAPQAHAVLGAVRTLPLFFVSVMLIEPMTTPAFPRAQVGYGMIGGLFAAFGAALPRIGLSGSLLVINLLNPLISRLLRPRISPT